MQSKFTIMRQGREKLLREAEFASTREHRKWMKENELKFSQLWEDTAAAQRNVAVRKRLRERGLVPVEVWVLPEHKDALRRFVEGLHDKPKQ